MHVPIDLRRRLTSAPAAALLVAGDTTRLLTVLAALGRGPLPPVFVTAAGFLVAPRTPLTRPVAGTVRLRRLAPHLYLPTDADLVPALHPDEAAGLTRAHGLVVLPGGRVLAYDFDSPLPGSALLSAGPIRRDHWEPLPEATRIAERLGVLRRPEPPGAAEVVLLAGKPDGPDDLPRPRETGAISTVTARAMLGAGEVLGWLGRTLGLDRLSRKAAELIERAVDVAPRLSEELLGRQEAALRELLRRFQTGDIEEALKRALPLGGASEQPGVAHSNAALPWNNLLYSLAGLLGTGRGRASIWYGGAEIQAQLSDEYRKAAEAAARRGDYRRAAYIYAKLLNDYPRAAEVLSAGGLHCDAAILYRDKLNWPRWAARAFQAAGDWDEAIRLYRLAGEHECAGDLFRKRGEEDLALAEYLTAARKLVADQKDHLAAGELLLRKTQRADLAGGFFAAGWLHRDDGGSKNAAPCAVALAQLLADGRTPGPLLDLVTEAEDYLEPAGRATEASTFFNALMTLVERPALAGVRDEMRDRARLGLALKLRQHAAIDRRAGRAVSDLFRSGPQWGPAVTRDADFALKAALKRQDRPITPPAPRPHTLVRLGVGSVTAACVAPESGTVFVGFRHGGVVAYQPADGSVVPVVGQTGCAVEGVATEARGKLAVVLRADATQATLTCAWRLSGGVFGESGRATVPLGETNRFLSPLLVSDGRCYLAGLYYRGGLELFRDPTLLSASTLKPIADEESAPDDGVVLLLPRIGVADPEVMVLHTVAGALRMDLYRPRRDPETGSDGWDIGTELASLRFTPDALGTTRLAAPALTWWLTGPDQLELASLAGEDGVSWRAVTFDESPCGPGTRAVTVGHSLGCPLAGVAFVRSRTLAVVEWSGRVRWLRVGMEGMDEFAPAVDLGGSNPTACFVSHPTGELLVVTADGHVIRVPVPV